MMIVLIVKWSLRTSVRSSDAQSLCYCGCNLVDADGDSNLFGYDACAEEEEWKTQVRLSTE